MPEELKVKRLDISGLIANIKDNSEFTIPKSRVESKWSEPLRLVDESLEILTGKDHIAFELRHFTSKVIDRSPRRYKSTVSGYLPDDIVMRVPD